MTQANKKKLRNISAAILTLIASFILFLAGYNPVPEPTQVENTFTLDGRYLVARVVDGDTIKLTIDGEDESVRLIGVDTPETVHPNKVVECFGIQASNYTKWLLEGKEVYVKFDDTQDQVDQYGRLLLYVWRVEDDLFLNQELILQGYAKEYTYRVPYEYQNAFKIAEESAQDEEVGLWGETGCDN